MLRKEKQKAPKNLVHLRAKDPISRGHKRYKMSVLHKASLQIACLFGLLQGENQFVSWFRHDAQHTSEAKKRKGRATVNISWTTPNAGAKIDQGQLKL